MTSLTELFAAPAEAVVHRLAPSATPAAIERAAVSAGWRFALVESGEAATKDDALGDFQRGLGLPGWFGRNLDALVDALRDVGDDEAPGTVLLWDRPTRFAADAADDYTAVLDVLAHRAGDTTRSRLVVLVRPAPTED
jgi:RNAse (barnase) inhibitor barstar